MTGVETRAGPLVVGGATGADEVWVEPHPAAGGRPVSESALPRARPASQRVRQPTEVRRLLLVEAAREVIAERGLFAVTVRDISEAGGVSAGTVSYHFTGIEEILGEVLKDEMTSFYAPLLASASRGGTAAEELRGLVDGFFSESPRTVQHLMRHSTLELTGRYTRPRVADQDAASAALPSLKPVPREWRIAAPGERI